MVRLHAGTETALLRRERARVVCASVHRWESGRIRDTCTDTGVCVSAVRSFLRVCACYGVVPKLRRRLLRASLSPGDAEVAHLLHAFCRAPAGLAGHTWRLRPHPAYGWWYAGCACGRGGPVPAKPTPAPARIASTPAPWSTPTCRALPCPSGARAPPLRHPPAPSNSNVALILPLCTCFCGAAISKGCLSSIVQSGFVRA